MSSAGQQDRLKVPAWMATVLFAAFLTMCGTAISTWARTTSNTDSIQDQKVRIDNLERKLNQIDHSVAGMDQKVDDMKTQQDNNSGKLDRILELEMTRHR